MTSTTLILSSIGIILLLHLFLILILTTVSHKLFETDEFRDHVLPIYQVVPHFGWDLVEHAVYIVRLDGGLSM